MSSAEPPAAGGAVETAADGSAAIPTTVSRGRQTLTERYPASAIRFAIPALIGIGVVLRVGRWAVDRSLWGDEGALALNILEKPYSGLLRQLDYNQGAPTGFLLAEKLAVGVFGQTELVLRLVPLLGGLLSLILFAGLARRILQPFAATLAVALFATLDPLVYYSSEVKQYSTDVAVALVVLYAAIRWDWRRASPRVLALIALGAAALAWFSHPGLLVLGSLGLIFGALALYDRDRQAVRNLLLFAAFPAASVLAAYVVNRRNSSEVAAQAIGSTSGSSGIAIAGPVKGVWHSYFSAFGFGRTAAALALLFTIAGALELWRARPRTTLVLASPVVATFLAAVASRYPYSDRFILFLTPIFVIFISEGAAVFVRVTWSRSRVIAVTGVLLLVAYPAGIAAERLVKPPGHEEVRTVLRHVSSRWQAGDSLFVWYQTQYPYRYYAECRACDVLTKGLVAATEWPRRPAAGHPKDALVSHPPQLYVGRDSQELRSYLADFSAIQGRRRVWFVFSSTWDDSFVKLLLDCRGRALDEFRATRAVAYLYDLGPRSGSGAACSKA